MTETTLIEYVGRQTGRVDDVLKTKRVWPAPGSVLDIPASEAGFYLMYPKEWREITPEQHAAREYARNEASDSLVALTAVWHDLALDDLQSMRDAINDEIDARYNAQPTEVIPVAGLPGPDASAADTDSRDAAHARLRAIMAVLDDMDDQDDEQYTDRGKPRVSVVADRVGFKVSGDEIGEALALIGGPADD